MELLLIRHAQPVTRVVAEGPADPELSAVGERQSVLLAEYLRPERIDALYASPLIRAQQTAAPLADSRNMNVVIVPEVSEYDRDANEYVPVEEMKRANDIRWKDFLASNREHLAVDSPFARGVIDAIDAIIDAHHGDKVAVVCHGGVINVAVAHVLGLARGGFFLPQYTSISRVAASQRGHRSIITLNEMAHIRGSGLTTGALHE